MRLQCCLPLLRVVPRWLTHRVLSPDVFSRSSGAQPAVACRSVPAVQQLRVTTPSVVQPRGWSHSFHQFASWCDIVVITGRRAVCSHAGLLTRWLGHAPVLPQAGFSQESSLAKRAWPHLAFGQGRLVRKAPLRHRPRMRSRQLVGTECFGTGHLRALVLGRQADSGFAKRATSA